MPKTKYPLNTVYIREVNPNDYWLCVSFVVYGNKDYSAIEERLVIRLFKDQLDKYTDLNFYPCSKRTARQPVTTGP